MQWLYRCLHHSSLPWRTRQISRCGWKNGAENCPHGKHFVLENTKLYGDPQIKIWSDDAETLNPDRKDWFLARQITEAGLVDFFLSFLSSSSVLAKPLQSLEPTSYKSYAQLKSPDFFNRASIIKRSHIILGAFLLMRNPEQDLTYSQLTARQFPSQGIWETTTMTSSPCIELQIDL